MPSRSEISLHNQGVAYTFRAQADLTDIAHLGKAVTLAGALAVNGREAAGILLSTADSGESMKVGVSGIIPYIATNIVSAGYALTVDNSAQFVALTVANYEVGIAYGTQGAAAGGNVNSGAMGVGNFDFAVKHYAAPGSGGVFV